MAAVAIILGIVLLIRLTSAPLDKPPFGTAMKVTLGILMVLCVAFVTWLGIRMPVRATDMLGQIVAAIFILIVFVAIGTSVRKKKIATEAMSNP
jgi:apolipoprotein N-acyltransferase